MSSTKKKWKNEKVKTQQPFATFASYSSCLKSALLWNADVLVNKMLSGSAEVLWSFSIAKKHQSTWYVK